MIKHIHLDVTRHANAHDRAQKHHADQAVDGDFLRPGVAVVEHVAGEELKEHAARHQPEKAERDPVLECIDLEINLGRRLVECMGEFLRRDLSMDFLRH
ncbi:hypothetical protein D3C78_1228970 [compost metagenome]